MRQSLKVPTHTLIVSAEKLRAKIVAQHARDVKAYTEALPRHQRQVAAALSKAARNPNKVRVDYGGYNRGYSAFVPVPKPPEKPSTKPDTHSVDRDLGLLRATSQETISVGSDSNYARYL